MASRLNPYLNFRGHAREALDFYATVFGGTPVVSTFGEFGDPQAEGADQVMHGQLDTPAGFTLMCADMPESMGQLTQSDNITVSLSGDDADALRGYWTGLAEGATVGTELEKQVWGDEFGALTDRFGIPWLVNISQR